MLMHAKEYNDVRDYPKWCETKTKRCTKMYNGKDLVLC